MRIPLTPTLLLATQFIGTSFGLPKPRHGDDRPSSSKADNTRAKENSATTLITPEEWRGTFVPTDRNSLTSTNTSTDSLSNTLDSPSLSLALINNLAGKVNAYITGLSTSGQLVMLKPDGTFFYPTCTNSQTAPLLVTTNTAIPLGAKGSTTNVKIPDYINSARVWYAVDDVLKFYIVWNTATNSPSLVLPSAANPSDASADINWGFVELTYTKAGLFANISYVDFVGLVLGLRLEEKGQAGVQTAQGLKSDALKGICDELIAQSKVDGLEWGKLCLADSQGEVLRVLSPSQYISSHDTAFANLWTAYNDQVWKQYQTKVLTINTQAAAGKITCQVSKNDNLLHCAGSSSTYARPTANDIFGCNTGPFAIPAGSNDVHKAIVPRLCAAFHRSTFLLAGGDVQPSTSAASYYSVGATNWYSRVVHRYEADGRGYAFPYDDVVPDGGGDVSGIVASANPGVLSIYVGGSG